jgi:hypothetical protein
MNMFFIWWERLPAANIAAAPCCHRLSRLEAAPTKEITQFSDHQQSWGYEDGSWKGPWPPLLVAADF